MKVIILLISVSFLVSCGKKNNRMVRTRTPILTNPPVYQLNYTCSRSYVGSRTVFNCYSRRESCTLSYGRIIGTYICNRTFGRFESIALDVFKCRKSAGAGQHMLSCHKLNERCYLSWGRDNRYRCERYEKEE